MISALSDQSESIWAEENAGEKVADKTFFSAMREAYEDIASLLERGKKKYMGLSERERELPAAELIAEAITETRKKYDNTAGSVPDSRNGALHMGYLQALEMFFYRTNNMLFVSDCPIMKLCRP